MIVLRSLLLASLGSYAIASSAGHKVRSVPLAVNTIELSPEHTIGDHSGRRAEGCDDLYVDANSCVSAGCATCINNKLDQLPSQVSCSLFQDTVCDAIYDDCNCGACTDELEDYFECYAISGGCPSFVCPQSSCACPDGDNGGAGGICLKLIDSSDCPADPNLSAGCTEDEVDIGELCEADNDENGTDSNADNCGNGYDVYMRISCDQGSAEEECDLTDFAEFCARLGPGWEPACFPPS